MKKIISILLTALSVLSAFSITAAAYTPDSDFDYTITGYDSSYGITIDKYKGTDSVVEIPPEIGRFPVEQIGDGAFSNNTTIEEVILPEGLLSISTAFNNCTKLKKINFPSTLENIYYSAFENCKSLTSITIPKNLEPFPANPFFGCSALKEIKADPNNPNYTVSDGVLYSKDMSTLYLYPAQKKGAFTIPDGVETIFHMAFAGNSDLTEIHIPKSVENISDLAFFNCKGLKSLTIPGTQNIYWNVFSDCSELESVVIEEGTTLLESMAFSDCTKLKSITLPASLTCNISDAFDNCRNLSEIIVDENNLEYSSIGAALTNKDKNYLIYLGGGVSGKYEIPQSITEVSLYAFKDCVNITELVIPATLKYVYFYSGDLPNLNTVTVDPDNENFSSVNGLLFDKNGSNLIYVPKQTSGVLNLPQGMKTFAISAFSNCSKLSFLTFPDGIESLDFLDLAECPSLTSVYVPDSATDISGELSFIYDTFPDTFVIIGNADSAAQEFANTYGIRFAERDALTLGDINLDGSINSTDATLALQSFASIKANDVFVAPVGDVNGDSIINATDATKILQMFSAIITEF